MSVSFPRTCDQDWHVYAGVGATSCVCGQMGVRVTDTGSASPTKPPDVAGPASALPAAPPEQLGHSDEYYLAMAALDQYPVDDGLPKSTSVVFRIHQLGHEIERLRAALQTAAGAHDPEKPVRPIVQDVPEVRPITAPDNHALHSLQAEGEVASGPDAMQDDAAIVLFQFDGFLTFINMDVDALFTILADAWDASAQQIDATKSTGDAAVQSALQSAAEHLRRAGMDWYVSTK